ncbi:hypothetical protein KY317_00660 [Candidatus Woesearchaeota archaeon]|nr:hypothetical protein [Candidatus Woesearchaeota archaeon]
MKKAQVSLQFHWIFIIIAGAIILGFFIGIALKQKSISDRKLASELLEEFNLIFSGAGATEETSVGVDIPNTEIEFSCIAGVSRYSINKISKESPYDIIFAPDLVKGRSIVTWTLPWRMPFRVQNFLMVIPTSVRYIIIYEDEAKALEIFGDLPDSITKEMSHIDELSTTRYTNNYRTRFVFLDIDDNDIEPPSDFKKIDDEAVSAVKITSTDAQFYEKKEDKFVSGDSVPIINDRPHIFGAIFAGNKDIYQCNTNKAHSRLWYVAGIYRERTEELKDKHMRIERSGETPPVGICSSFFYIPTEFDKLINGARAGDLSEITSGARELKERNEILQNAGCPLIY